MKSDDFDRPVIMLDSIVLDCRDAKSLADFYERLLGWRRSAGGDEWEAVSDPEGRFHYHGAALRARPGYRRSPSCQC